MQAARAVQLNAGTGQQFKPAPPHSSVLARRRPPPPAFCLLLLPLPAPPSAASRAGSPSPLRLLPRPPPATASPRCACRACRSRYCFSATALLCCLSLAENTRVTWQGGAAGWTDGRRVQGALGQAGRRAAAAAPAARQLSRVRCLRNLANRGPGLAAESAFSPPIAHIGADGG